MSAQVGFSQPSDVSSGGKGMGGGSYVGPQGPQMGFGMDANTGLPFGSQPQPLPQANDMVGGNPMGFGGGLAGAAMNVIQSKQSMPQQVLQQQIDVNNLSSDYSPMYGSSTPVSTDIFLRGYTDQQGNQYDQTGKFIKTVNPKPATPEEFSKLFGGGKSGGFGPGASPQGPFTPRPDLGPNVGFGVGLPQPQLDYNPDRIEVPRFANVDFNNVKVPSTQLNQIQAGLGNPQGGVYGRDLSGNPNTQQLMGGMGTFTNVPAPQPVNRFAPPNAPGVRQQPRTAPRAGIPVQSARTVQPNRFTNTRTRPR